MYYYHIIFLIANLLVLVASSDNLFSLDNSENSLFDPNSILELDASTTAQQPTTIDDLDSGLELMDFDDSVDPTISFEDDAPTILANNAPQSHCAAAAAAADASDFITLEARADGQSCTTHGSSSSSPNLLSPETVQLFQDPTTGLNNLVSPPSKEKNQGGPSGSGEPPNPPPGEPLYPAYLPDGNTNAQTLEQIKLELEKLGLESRENDFYCNDGVRKVPVCCDGPLRYANDIANCDTLLPWVEGTGGLIPGPNPQGPFFCSKKFKGCCYGYIPRERKGVICEVVKNYRGF